MTSKTDYIPTNAPGYMKDTKSKLIINTNDKEYERIKSARQQKQKVDNLNQRVSNLETDISDIKQMLVQLLQK